MNREDDFLHKLDLIFAYLKELLKFQQQVFSRQEELFMLVQSTNQNLLSSHGQEDSWLTKAAVMDELCITESTFYRRQAAGSWQRRKSGNTWYYLKSSLISS